MGLSDDVDKLAKNQATLQKNYTILKNKVDVLAKRVAELEGSEPEEDAPVTASAKSTPKAAPTPEPETSKPIENLGFKIFGAVGFVLILLGLFFLYRYAVDEGYLGITGRIVVGTLFAVGIIGLGEAFRRKSYARFSQLLTGGGLALLYFTFYSTYLFKEYREALGMTAPVNAVMLFIVMIIAVVLALRYDSMLLTAYAFLLGYLAPLLIGAVQPTGSIHAMMIATLLLSIGFTIILWKKNWPMGIYPVVISYLLYTIAFFASNVIRYAPAGQIPDVVGPALFYLLCFFLLFNGLSILLQDSKTSAQNVAIAIVNSLAVLAFGLSIVWHYWSSMRGVFLVFIAALYVGMMFVARARELRNMFETFFLLCITFVTIAIPVQLSGAWIALAWAIEGALLVRSGVRVEVRGIRVLGYIALGLAFINVLFWGVNLPVWQRMLGFAVTIAAMYASAYLLLQEKDPSDAQRTMAGLLAVLGSVLLAVMLYVEIMDPQGLLGTAALGSRRILLSILWAAVAVAFIVLGFMGRSHPFRVMGLVLFGITVLKILVLDLDNLSPIGRTMVTIIVGIIALGAAFAYVRNKDRIKAYLEA